MVGGVVLAVAVLRLLCIWALAVGSNLVVKLLGGRVQLDGVVRVVALQAVAATSDC